MIYILKMEFKTKYGDFLVYPNDEIIVSYFKNGKVYEEDFIIENLGKYIQRSEYVLDIGAHIGSHCITYCKLNPNVKIIAFEPQAKVFDLLNKNVINNMLTNNIQVLNTCVGHKNTNTRLAMNASDSPNADNPVTYGDEHSQNIGGIGIGDDGEECSMITIDSLNLKGCDFMKVDVEGFEPLVFLGAVNTINNFKPVICFEKNHKDISIDMYNKLDINIPYRNLTSFELLIGLDYIIFYEGSGNYIAVHRSKVSMMYNF